MKKTRKLRRYIIISLSLIALVMIAGYSIFVEYALFKGLVETASFDLYVAARDFESQYADNLDASLPEGPRLKAFLGDENLPGWFKKRHPSGTLKHGEIELDEVDGQEFGLGKWFIYIALAHDLHDGNRLYLIKLYTEKDDIPGTFQFSESAELVIFCIGIAFITLVFGAASYLFRKVFFSVELLADWAKNLDRKRLEQPRPNFHFEEINQLADLIQDAASDLHQALNREHHFLRNASHELRTPIAIIQTNIDLLERLPSRSEDNKKIPHQRIRRAVDNMHQLTETLLWLSRKEETMPSPESININEMVEELVQANQYLLSDKNIDLDLNLEEAKATLPRAALGIVLGNLIRNAFQHTEKGRVAIRVAQNAVTITNTASNQGAANPAANDYGFGLGLILVEQICQKLNLSYENISISGGFITKLSL